MQTWLRELLKIRDTNEAWARGAAVGFFFGVSVFWGLQFILAVAFSHWLRGNKIVAGTMTFVSNPITTLPLYSLAYLIGHAALGGADPQLNFSTIHSWDGFLAVGPWFLAVMLVGTTCLGLAGGVLLYFLVKLFKKARVER